MKIIAKEDLMELVNLPQVEETYYVDLKEHCVVLYDSMIKETENLLRIPYQEELVPYNQAVKEFIEITGLDIPRGSSVRRYLRDCGLIQEFYNYWSEETVSRLSEWLEKHQVKYLNIA